MGLPEDEQMDRELIMNHFRELSNIFTNFQVWFNSGDSLSLKGILSSDFESSIWSNKTEFLGSAEKKDFSPGSI